MSNSIYSIAGIGTVASVATAAIIGTSYYYYNQKNNNNKQQQQPVMRTTKVNNEMSTKHINQMENSFIKLIQNLSVFRFSNPELFDNVVELTDLFCYLYLKIHNDAAHGKYVTAINRVHVDLKNALFELERSFEQNYNAYSENWLQRIKDLTDALDAFRVNTTRQYRQQIMTHAFIVHD
jgi:predicted RNase H-like nuclease